ncbi:hypothetical protein V8E36_000487 [Tilletia maclaganii]
MFPLSFDDFAQWALCDVTLKSSTSCVRRPVKAATPLSAHSRLISTLSTTRARTSLRPTVGISNLCPTDCAATADSGMAACSWLPSRSSPAIDTAISASCSPTSSSTCSSPTPSSSSSASGSRIGGVSLSRRSPYSRPSRTLMSRTGTKRRVEALRLPRPSDRLPICDWTASRQGRDDRQQGCQSSVSSSLSTTLHFRRASPTMPRCLLRLKMA